MSLKLWLSFGEYFNSEPRWSLQMIFLPDIWEQICARPTPSRFDTHYCFTVWYVLMECRTLADLDKRVVRRVRTLTLLMGAWVLMRAAPGWAACQRTRTPSRATGHHAPLRRSLMYTSHPGLWSPRTTATLSDVHFLPGFVVTTHRCDALWCTLLTRVCGHHAPLRRSLMYTSHPGLWSPRTAATLSDVHFSPGFVVTTHRCDALWCTLLTRVCDHHAPLRRSLMYISHPGLWSPRTAATLSDVHFSPGFVVTTHRCDALWCTLLTRVCGHHAPLRRSLMYTSHPGLWSPRTAATLSDVHFSPGFVVTTHRCDALWCTLLTRVCGHHAPLRRSLMYTSHPGLWSPRTAATLSDVHFSPGFVVTTHRCNAFWCTLLTRVCGHHAPLRRSLMYTSHPGLWSPRTAATLSDVHFSPGFVSVQCTIYRWNKEWWAMSIKSITISVNWVCF